MSEKTISIKIIESIYETILSELIIHNLGINSTFEFSGLNYKIVNVSSEEVNLILKNNTEYYLKDSYDVPVKQLNITKNGVIMSNLVKPTTYYKIEILEIKNEFPKVFM